MSTFGAHGTYSVPRKWPSDTVRELGDLDLNTNHRRHHGLIVKSTVTEESRLGMKGKTIVLYYRLWVAEGRPLLDLQAGESLNPVVFRQSSTNCARPKFLEADIFHLSNPTIVDNRLVY